MTCVTAQFGEFGLSGCLTCVAAQFGEFGLSGCLTCVTAQFGEFGLSGCLTTALDSDGSSQSLPLADWHMKEDIAELFSKLGIGRYTDLFLQQEVG